MTPAKNKTQGKVTLDIEIQDLLDMVARNKSSPITPAADPNIVGAEEIRKAWFNYMLATMEKLSDALEDIRRVDISALREELKSEIKRLEEKADKREEELAGYKKDIVEPMKSKILILATKVALYSSILGAVGTAIVFTLVKYVFK